MISGLTDLGRDIEIKRINKGLCTGALCKAVSQETGLYFDRYYYMRIVRGENSNPKILQALESILGA